MQFPGLDGVLPGFGRHGRTTGASASSSSDAKSPHWTGARNSPRTFGHFGRSGTFLWVDPERELALACLTDRDFGDWAKEAWPRLSDAVLAGGTGLGCPATWASSTAGASAPAAATSSLRPSTAIPAARRAGRSTTRTRRRRCRACSSATGACCSARRIEPRQGHWDLPGGFLEEGEEPLEGLRREFREETGLEVEPVEWLGAFLDPYNAYLVLGLTWVVRAEGEPSPPTTSPSSPGSLPTSFRRRWRSRARTRAAHLGREAL